MNTSNLNDVESIIRHIEEMARELDGNADATPSSIVRAVNQGQAIVLRELLTDLRRGRELRHTGFNSERRPARIGGHRSFGALRA